MPGRAEGKRLLTKGGFLITLSGHFDPAVRRQSMIEGKLVDLVPFEDDFAIYLETWMNEESWFRTRLWERREPHTEDDVKKFIEKMEKSEHGALFGFQSKSGDPIGGVIFDH
jgi:RimJ/RimL family protein N-acetyltransferase